MADVKISALPVSGAVAAGDEFPIVNGGVTKKATAADMPVSTAQAAADTVTDNTVSALNLRTAGISAKTAPSRIGVDKVLRYDTPPTFAHNDDLASVGKVQSLIREFNSTVDEPIAAANPTRAECIAGFKQLPNFDWSKDDTFFMRDLTGAPKWFFVHYRANGDTTEAGGNYIFIYEPMKLAT